MEGNYQVNNIVYKFDVTRPFQKKNACWTCRERVRERERERTENPFL